jgi:glucokinase
VVTSYGDFRLIPCLDLPIRNGGNALSADENPLTPGVYSTGRMMLREARMTADLEKSVLVYDVGGSHVAASVCQGLDYRLGTIVSQPYPAEQSSDAFLGFLHALGVKASAGFAGVSGAELAFPGPFDFAAGVSQMKHKLPFLYGVDLRQGLAERFGWQPAEVRFLHDSAAFLLGEVGAGAARGLHRAVGITLGTGIGSAFAVDGRVVTEGAGVPPGGEIWNLPYEGGILEDSLSTRGIQGNYQKRTGQLRQVVDLAAAAADDTDAAAVFADFGRHLGIALRKLASGFNPQVVVLGGAISRSARLFLPAAESQLQGLNLRLLPSTLKDNAPLVGAAVAWFHAAS